MHTALTLRLPTGADEEAVAPQMRENASLGKNALLARCLRIASATCRRTGSRRSGPKIMRDLTMTDRRLIDRALNEAAPGVDLVREIECPRCGEDVPDQPGPDQFFSAGLDLDDLRSEIFFLAYHLHWSWAELMDLDTASAGRTSRLLVEQIERENARIEAARD